ncbi:MAG: hypothetical protein AABX07_04355 [Nanoarchaeota archaeon]
MLKEDLDIVNVFRKNLFLADSIRGIMIKMKNKSYGRVFTAAQELLKQGVLNSQKLGMSTVCSINLNDSKALAYLSFLDFMEFNSKITGELAEKIKSLAETIPLRYFSFIIGEGYPERKTSKKRVLDVLVIVENEIDSTKILNLLENNCKLMKFEVKVHVFKVSEFLNMLLSKEENYAKNILKKKLVFYGSQNYYAILREAIEHGFRA